MEHPLSHISCPGCQKQIRHQNKESIYFVCDSCQVIFNKNREILYTNLDVNQLFRSDLLELGDIFRHNGIDYEVSGKIVKKEKKDPHAYWTEYVLTHPENENIYLSEWNGHWNLIEYIPEDVHKSPWKKSEATRSFYFNNIIFKYYHKYQIDILSASGEFNFNFMEDDGAQVYEFINPPGLVSIEYNDKKRSANYFFGMYLFPSEVKKRIQRKVSFYTKRGVAGNQPFWVNINIPNFQIGSAIIITFLLIFQLIYKYQYPDLTLTRSAFETDMNNKQTYIIKNINIPYDRSMLNIVVECSYLDNDWAALDMVLVNDQSGEIRSFNMNTEFYSGYEGGEHWTEGSRKNSGSINRVRKGKYHIEVTPIQQEYTSPKMLSLEIECYKASWKVFLFFLVLLILINIILIKVQEDFEQRK